MLATIVLPMKSKCAHSNQSGRYMLATIVLLKKCIYALTIFFLRVEMTGTCQQCLCCS